MLTLSALAALRVFYGHRVDAGRARGQSRGHLATTPGAIALTAISIGRTYACLSDETLWREAVAHAPDKVRPKIQLSRDVPPAEAFAVLDLAASGKPPAGPWLGTLSVSETGLP